MADRETRIDAELVKEDRPITVRTDFNPVLANIEQVKKLADGAWYRVARFGTESAAYNRAGTLRKRPDMQLVELKGSTIKATDPLLKEAYDEGWRSQLHCRFIGAPGQAGAKAAPKLRGIAGGGGDHEEEADDAPTTPGRRRKS